MYQQIPISQWLSESSQVGLLINKLSESIILLKSKRVTLEEKMIARYLHDLASLYGSLIARIHDQLKNNIEPQVKLLAELHEINTKTVTMLNDLLKIIKYDLNFLEQYYEHDLLGKLTQEYCLKEDLARILQEVSD